MPIRCLAGADSIWPDDLEQKPGIKLLPVRVSESKSAPVVVEHGVTDFSQPQPGTIHIELRQAQVRIEGNADPALVRVLLECLRA
jgi:hypothetical protein